MEELITTLEQLSRAVSILVQRADLQEKDAVTISAFYPLWQPGKSYGNNQWLRWGQDANGKWLLYATTKNVTSAAGASPDVTPGAYKLLG